jgi:ribosomal protein L24E
MKTKEEIIIKNLKKRCPELYKLNDVVIKALGLPLEGWRAIEDAMDEWHKESLPTIEEIQQQRCGFASIVYADGFERGARWCRDFVRQEKKEPEIKCEYCGNPVRSFPSTIYSETQKKGLWFCNDNCMNNYILSFKKPSTVRGNFVFDELSMYKVQFVPDPDGKFEIIKK